MILAVIMLSMTAIGVNAEELIVGFDDLLEAVGIIEHDHEEEELMAMASIDSCGNRCRHLFLDTQPPKDPAMVTLEVCKMCTDLSTIAQLYELYCTVCGEDKMGYVFVCPNGHEY